jgi:hypothetical protein
MGNMGMGMVSRFGHRVHTTPLTYSRQVSMGKHKGAPRGPKSKVLFIFIVYLYLLIYLVTRPPLPAMRKRRKHSREGGVSISWSRYVLYVLLLKFSDHKYLTNVHHGSRGIYYHLSPLHHHLTCMKAA